MSARPITKAASRVAASRKAPAAPEASGMPRWKAAIYTAGFTAVGIVGVWAGAGLKNDHDQREEQKRIFQQNGIEDDVGKRIALLEQRKARLDGVKKEFEQKAARIQDRMNGKEGSPSQGLGPRQSMWKDN